MKEYAISLYFDEQTRTCLHKFTNVAANACGSVYMLEPKPIPPHITVCYFKANNPAVALNLIEEKTRTLNIGRITWASLGAFVPTALFVAPVLNEYLLKVCSEFNALLDGKVELVDYYRPYNWVPHTTLATKLTLERLNKAFDGVAKEFAPFTGTATALSFAVCERFEEIKIWQLINKTGVIT